MPDKAKQAETHQGCCDHPAQLRNGDNCPNGDSYRNRHADRERVTHPKPSHPVL